MNLPERIADFGWFGAGWAVFKGGTADPDFYPPLDDTDAQREWLAGFGAAWVECPDDEAVESILNGDGMGGESVEEALVRVLESRDDLLRALWALGLNKIARVIH
jgi:hypothetical protein